MRGIVPGTSTLAPPASTDPPPGIDLAVGFAALGVYVFATAPAPYLLDSAELAAASFGLGVAHPPGETVALLWGKLFALVPLGSVAFRVGIGQAIAGAIAAALTFRLAWRLLVPLVPSLDRATRGLLAAAAAGSFAFAPGVIFSSNRPEVYALAAALALGALVAVVEPDHASDPRPLLLAALLIGLGVGNHPLVAGLTGAGAVVMALPHLLRSAEAGAVNRGRLCVWAVGLFVVGVAVLVYLPLRTIALDAPFAPADSIVWGAGRTLSGLWWILSARTFVGKTTVVHAGATPEALPFTLFDELGIPVVLLALVGLFYGLRLPRTRLYVAALTVALLGAIAAAWGGGFDPQNPDIHGYLEVALAVLPIFAAAALALLLTVSLRPMVTRAIAGLSLIGVLAFAFPLRPTTSLRHAQTADAIAHDLLADLPPRAALFTAHFETAFLVAYQRLVEGQRPDVDWIHLGFVRGPGYADRMARARPELAALIEAHRRGPLSRAAIAAFGRPVMFEPDDHLGGDLQAHLSPRGWLWQAPSTVATPAAFAPLSPAFFHEADIDRQVRGFLAWRAYLDAHLACAQGQPLRARPRIDELRRLLPADPRLRDLELGCNQSPP